jgi:hypothetical protein
MAEFTSVGSFARFQYVDDITNFPKTLGCARAHRTRSRLMDTNEIAIEEMRRHRVRVVFHIIETALVDCVIGRKSFAFLGKELSRPMLK